MDRFYFGDSDESDADPNDKDDNNLPFPKPLARASFLAPDFDPATFLSTLSNRHQTLGDLQTELRDLSQSLNKELLDLVNENYQDFLSLGTALKGGEEKVEEVRAALLSYERDVQNIRDQFRARTGEIRASLEGKKELRSDIAVGYDLLDIAERIEVLEKNLMIGGAKRSNTNGLNSQGQAEENSNQGSGDDESSNDSFESETDDSDEDETFGSNTNGGGVVSLRRLERHINDYLCLKTIISRVGERHTFVISHGDRVTAIKQALLLDIDAALRRAGGSKKRDKIEYWRLCISTATLESRQKLRRRLSN